MKENKISIIGGDLRIVKLIEILSHDGYSVFTYGLEKAENLKKDEKIVGDLSLEEVIASSRIIIAPIPFSSNGIQINTPFSDEKIAIEELINQIKNKIFIAGSIKPEIKEKLEQNGNMVIDLMQREELAVLNTVSTAEGAIQIAIEQTARTIHGSKVLVMGFGRVGKILAHMLEGIGANVYCEARKNIDIAWIKAYGYQAIYLNELEKHLDKFDVIINTIPSMILDEKRLDRLKEDCLIIDLASNPGGVDMKQAKQKGIKVIWALSLPGKVAPITSAEFIKETLYNIFQEVS